MHGQQNPARTDDSARELSSELGEIMTFKDSNYFPIDVFFTCLFSKKDIIKSHSPKNTKLDGTYLPQTLRCHRCQPHLKSQTFPPKSTRSTGDDPLITEHFSSNEEALASAQGRGE